jgi:sulfite oxidase
VKGEPHLKESSGKGTADLAAVETKVGFTTGEKQARSETAKDIGPVTNLGCDSQTSAEPVALQGYACSGGGREISRVDVSLDGGKTWDQADLVEDWTDQHCKGSKHWAWKRWRYVGLLPRLPLSSNPDGGQKHCTELVVKATDDSYNTQPGDHKAIYNVRGNLATAWHRVKVCPRCVPAGRDGIGKGVTWSTAETYGCGFEKEAEEVRDHMLASEAK